MPDLSSLLGTKTELWAFKVGNYHKNHFSRLARAKKGHLDQISTGHISKTAWSTCMILLFCIYVFIWATLWWNFIKIWEGHLGTFQKIGWFASEFYWKKRSSHQGKKEVACIVSKVQISSFLFVGLWRICKSSKIQHPGCSGGFVL